MNESQRTPVAPTPVVLIDDHDVIAVALEDSLEGLSELEFAGAGPTVDEVLAGGSASGGIAVLDLRLADGSSPSRNVERLTEAGYAVVAYTSGENPFLLRVAARSLIWGIVRKSEPMPLLIEALLACREGRPTLSAEWAAAMQADRDLDEAGLSAQEQRVLQLAATGLKSQTVASTMGIATTTVDDYIRRIRAKYARIGRRAATKVDLYKRAVEDGFLPPPTADS